MFSDLYFRLRCLLRRERVESELDEELRFHYEQQTEKLMRGGLTREEAQRRARLIIGGVDQVKEECRDARGVSFVETLAQDVRFALRLFRKSPAFTITAVLTLALGIAANTAIFSVVEGVLLKPLPYPHSEQLVSVAISPLALDASLRGLSGEEYFIFREQSRTFQDIGAYIETDSDRDVNVTGLAEPERVHAVYVTDGALSVLGIPAMLGRFFSRADDSAAAPATALLTYGYWQRRFGGSPSAIGKTIVTNGTAREIVGVLPRTFRFLDEQDLSLVLPMQLDRSQVHLGNFIYFGIARLTPGTTIAEASADISRLLPISLSAFPPDPSISVDLLQKAHLAPSLLTLKEEVIGNVGRVLWVLMGGVGMVLLIACANVANLLLVRTEGRRHELALRAALGASRRRIAVQLLRESAMLGLLGGVFGIGLAYVALRLVVRLAPSGLPRIKDIGIDMPVLLFGVGTALFTSLLFGMIPILKHSSIPASLGEEGRTVSPGRQQHRAQNLLVTAQVALALVLLICSGLMIRTFRVLTHVNPGFVAPAELQTFRVSIPNSYVPDEARVTPIEQQILNKLAAIPGVSSATFSSDVPMDGDSTLDNIFVADHPHDHGGLPPLRHFQFISPGYFQTFGIPILAGRDLTWAETYERVPVALVSENFAREYWGSPAEALGKRIRHSAVDDWRQIIGVVGDVHDQGLDKPARSTAYWPTLMTNFRGKPMRAARYTTFILRTPLAGSESLMAQVRRTVWSVDANLPLARVHTMNFFYGKSMARTSFTLAMLAIAGGMALLLGTVGLYGVIAYSVSQRTREIGVRIALGAQRGNILALVVGHGIAIISVGLAAGTVAALLITRLLSSMLFGIRPEDPLTYSCVVILLSTVALFACYIPARRAARVQPMLALRCE
jgi:predicted permease